MPTTEYASRPDTVLAYKRTHQIGRFDPQSSTNTEQIVHERGAADEALIRARGIEVGRRCRVNRQDERRGVVAFVGMVDGLGGQVGRGARWVGVRLDEPVGRNDGRVCVALPLPVLGESGEEEEEERVGTPAKEEMKRLFECRPGFGLVVRPDKVEVGAEWTPLDDLAVDVDDDDEDDDDDELEL